MKEQVDNIGRMMIIVSTPGRLLQHMDENPSFSCDYLKILGT
jgi:superfamily II DNA/RNA helicase